MVFNISDSGERRYVSSGELPYEVTKLTNVAIPMKDGAKLYAHIWIPKKAYENSITVGTLVEYLPYRKNDFTAIRDSVRHPYYAGYGFASIRVDMRGCGDSDGVLLGEYLLQEQDDNLEVFDWIVKQPWSNGNIGQFGKSWGGFNGLQVAARQHPALKTIITICSTDDRYADDVHYRGGCLLASDMLWWASTMFVYNARPQDPKVRKDWRENWLQRLELEPNVIDWVSHQTRDAFWKHGSICEDYSKVNIPVLAVGGWRDGYTNAIFRMMDNLPNEDNKAVIGPWVHEYPEVATPSPGVGYNQIAVQWFSKYLNTDKTDVSEVDSLGKYNAYIQDPCSTEEAYESRDGIWVSEEGHGENSLELMLDLVSKSLGDKSTGQVSFTGSQEHGLFRGSWCPFGQNGDFPSDQKMEDGKCLTLDSAEMDQDYPLFGFPSVKLQFSSDSELANVSVRLVDLNPHTNEHFLVSWGMANLSHLSGSHEHPEKLVPDQRYTFSIQLDAVGYKIAKGHRLRLCLSPTDWPSSWPTAKAPTLTLYEGSSLSLPLVKYQAADYKMPAPESLPPCERTILREEGRTRKIVYDLTKDVWTIDDFSDEGKRSLVGDGIEMGSWNKNIWSIKPNDPLSAFNQCDWELTLGRGEWQTKLLTTSTMKADRDNFLLYNKLEAFENEKKVFEKSWTNTIPRNFV